MPSQAQLSISQTARRSVRFLLNGKPVAVDNLPITTTVLSYIRQEANLKGTKEGCAEGDCGACTVVVGEIRDDRLVVRAINACVQLLPTLDGKALFTVEYLRQAFGSLHPVQEAMVACHGSQCGFCTPGFVMSLWALYLESAACAPDEFQLRQAISGNLCRCTGYRPIIEAGKHMYSRPHVGLDRNAMTAALAGIRETQSLQYVHHRQTFFSPRTVEELLELRATYPDAALLAGGTDIGVWINKQLRQLESIIYVGNVCELTEITEDADSLTIGAAVTLNDAYAATRAWYPQMNQLWERFASPPIRNAGTLGGNIANGSPIGDSMPALIALGASVQLVRRGAVRQIALEDLYLGYRQNALAPDELLASVTLSKPVAGLRFRTYKVSKRYDSDISAVCAAFAIRVDGALIVSCRIAFGGMSAIPQRACKTENSLTGKLWSEDSVIHAMEILAQEFVPLSDMRASAEYRAKLAGNLLYRFYLETRLEPPLSPQLTDVFSERALHE